MRRVALVLLLVFAFAVPWEYSMDFGVPLGNIARFTCLLVLLAAVPAVLQAGRLRTPGLLQWLVMALYVWFCLSYFWTIDPEATLDKLRGYFQVMMVVWLVWEFVESPFDLRALLRAYVAGSWVLAVLTVADAGSVAALAEGQMRYTAMGQDPNDVARFLDLGFPLAALLLNSEPKWPGRLLALGYLPLGLVAVLLTASRGGFLGALVALAGCGILLVRGHAKTVVAGAFALPAVAALVWFSISREVFERLATIPEQLKGGDLNQRFNIWSAGWDAFVQSPLIGSGAGSFAAAAGLNPLDTAHNTALSILVSGGLCAFLLAVCIVIAVARAAMQTRGTLRMALMTVLLVWVVTSLVATVEENRTTWLLLGLIAVAGRLGREDGEQLAACFPDVVSGASFELTRPGMQSVSG
ncbi:MAG: O-antigen ligase family protein [Terracidiphilus sp.]|jgi:O-antigen ligase